MSIKIRFLTYKEICLINKIKYDDGIAKEYYITKRTVEDFIKKSDDKTFEKIVRFLNMYHTGMRKGDKIPEIQHFLNICMDIISIKDYILSTKLCIFELIKIALLHDLYEDYNKYDKIWEMSIERLKFKSEIEKDTIEYLTEDKKLTDKVLALSKIDKLGKQKKSKKYYKEISLDASLIIVKMLDRKDSLKSMQGVFSEEKKSLYEEQYERYIKFLSKDIEKDDEKLQFLFMLIRYRIKLVLKK